MSMLTSFVYQTLHNLTTKERPAPYLDTLTFDPLTSDPDLLCVEIVRLYDEPEEVLHGLEHGTKLLGMQIGNGTILTNMLLKAPN